MINTSYRLPSPEPRGANVNETHSKKALDVSISSSAIHVFVVYKMQQDSCFSKLLWVVTTQITFCTLPNRSRKKICSVCHTFVFDITGVRKHNTQNIMKETTAETVVNFAKFSMRTELIIMVYHSKFTTVLQEAVWQEIDEN